MKSILLYGYWFINGLFFAVLIPLNPVLKIKESYLLKRLHQIAKRTLKITGSNISVEGLENIKSDNFLLVSNHESIFDPVIITSFVKNPHTYIAKKELAKIFLFKYWGERIHALFIDRNNMRDSMKVIMSATKNTQSGHNYLIFPEGTRNSQDEEFKSGSLKIAQKAKVNIIPITIRNSSEIFEKNKKICSANVRVKIHPEYRYEDYKELNIVDISEHVQKIVRSYK